jgi:hypothetical protein
LPRAQPISLPAADDVLTELRELGWKQFMAWVCERVALAVFRHSRQAVPVSIRPLRSSWTRQRFQSTALKQLAGVLTAERRYEHHHCADVGRTDRIPWRAGHQAFKVAVISNT